MALVTHGALRRVPALLSPSLMLAPNVSVLFALVLCLGPAAVFFGTLAVGEGMIPEGC